MHPLSSPHPLRLAVIGAGPVGLSLALHAAQALPAAQISLFDARPLCHDVSADARTLALSLGSVQLLQRLHAWDAAAAQPITEVHVSQLAPAWGGLRGSLLGSRLGGASGEPAVRIRAADERVPMLGAVLAYGAIVAPLQRAWEAACAQAPQRLFSRFGVPVGSLKPLPGAVEIDASIADVFDLAVVAEGGVFAPASAAAAAEAALPRGHLPLRRDYGQTAWVGSVTLRGARPGVAYERFTRHGPAALLPLPHGRAGLVWCVDSRDDPVDALDDAQRLAVLRTLFPAEVGEELVAVSSLKRFALALSAERTLTDGRSVRIGNAAQTLHPVAGQGLNLGLRDAFELVRGLSRRADGDVDAVLRRLEWQRAPDRWALIAATDFLARSFTWQLPGASTARGLGLVALQALAPLKSALTRQMMYGRR